MKNLVIANQKVFSLPESVYGALTGGSTSVNHGAPLTLDSAKQILYFTNSSLTLFGYSLIDKKIVIEIPLVSPEDSEEELLSAGDIIVSLQYLPESEAVAVVASNADVGTIMQVTVSASASIPAVQLMHDDFDDEFMNPFHTQDAAENEVGAIELIGQIPGGFSDAAWSPDHEMIVLACNSGSLLIMSKEFEVIVDTTLIGDKQAQTSVTASNPYNFLPGTDQYKAHQVAEESNTLINTCSERDASVCWRGDGQYFVTSSLANNNTRVLRTWNRQGQLQSQSEAVAGYASPTADVTTSETDALTVLNQQSGLFHKVSWRPSGNLITSVQRSMAHKGQELVPAQQVVFYERNGLRRGEFDLLPSNLPSSWTASQQDTSSSLPPALRSHYNGTYIIDLQWSADSKVLAIASIDVVRNEVLVQCWSMGNYHWYLKQQFTFPASTKTGSMSVSLMWQSERPSRLIILLHQSQILVYDMIWSTVLAPTPLASCVVTDGHVLLVTHLQKSTIPPPLAARNILCPDLVQEPTFCRTVAYDDYMRTVAIRDTAVSNIVKHSAGGVRMDLVAPLCALTVRNQVLFFTDALPPSLHTPNIQPLGSVHAPLHHPERAMGLSKSTATHATTSGFGMMDLNKVLSCLFNEAPHGVASSSVRHLEWINCDQWRDTLLQFTPETQEFMIQRASMVSESINSGVSSQSQVASPRVADAHEWNDDDDDDVDVDMDDDIDFMSPTSSSSMSDNKTFVVMNEYKNNLISLTHSSIDEDDMIVFISFKIAMVLDIETKTFKMEFVDVQVKSQALRVSFTTTAVNAVGEMGINTQQLPSAITSLHTSITATYLVNPGCPLPLPPTDPNNTALVSSDSALLRAWIAQHNTALRASPWLAVLDCTGHVSRVDVHIQDSVCTYAQSQQQHQAGEAQPGLNRVQSVSMKTSSTTPLGYLAPQDTLWFAVADMAGSHVIVARDSTQRLLVNNTVVAPQCMSFALVGFNSVMANLSVQHSQQSVYSSTGHGSNVKVNAEEANNAFKSIPTVLLPSFLLITVAGQQHALFTLDLRKTLAENIEPASDIRLDPHMVRYVERGSNIVAPIADLLRPRLILQMPRGNLELITPRSLGLSAIHVALSSGQYLQAFLSMRANRIDMNLLFDHDPEQFERDVDEVVKQLRTSENISLFLSALSEDDCTMTQFPRYQRMFTSMSKQTKDELANIMATGVSSQGPEDMISFESGLAMLGSNAMLSEPSENMSLNSGAFSAPTNVHAELDWSSLRKSSDVNNPDDNSSTGPMDSTTTAATTVTDDMRELAEKLQSSSSQPKPNTGGVKAALHTSVSFSNRTRAHQALNQGVDAQDAALATDMDKEMGLGAEANATLAADGSGMSLLSQMSRVQHWGSGDMDIRHVYNNAADHEHNLAAANATATATTDGGDAKTDRVHRDVRSPADLFNQSSSGTSTSATEKKKAYTSKINHVCHLVLQALRRADQDPHGRQFLIASLTAHLRCSPPAFTKAVELIAEVARVEAQEKTQVVSLQPALPKPKQAKLGPRPDANVAKTDEKISLVTAEKALKYVLILADSNELWKASLSIYNLTLAASIAQHSGRDPKTYLPFLADLHKTVLYGPVLTQLQTTSVSVRQAVSFLQEAVKVNGSDEVFDSETIVFSHDELSKASVPLALGTLLQRGAIDVHLQRIHYTLSHYSDALALIHKTVLDTSVELIIRVKCALFALHLHKLSLDYIKRSQHFELAVNLFCAPLPSPPPISLTLAFKTGEVTVEDDMMDGFTIDQLTANDNRTSAHARTILAFYAQWLRDEKRFAEAGEAFRLVGDYHKAVEAYIDHGDWELANSLMMFNTTIFSEALREKMYLRMVDVLVEKKQYQAAASIREKYLRDATSAVRLLLKVAQWNSALQMSTLCADVSHTLNTIVLPTIITAAQDTIADCKIKVTSYHYAVDRLRTVRRVKLIIFGAIAGLKSSLELWNKGSKGVGGAVNDLPAKPQLVLRLPGDDVLEFIITGVWRGVQTGLCADGTGAGSIANYSTATGATLASIAPSVAASIASLSSAISGRGSMASMLSTASMASQSSILSVSSEAAALTASERKLEKHLKKMKSKKQKKKIREGDPREEAELQLDLASYTPTKSSKQAVKDLIHVLYLINQQALAVELQTAFKELLLAVEAEEAKSMPALEGASAWQNENIQNYWNWPASSHMDEKELEEKLKKRDDEREKEKERQKPRPKNFKQEDDDDEDDEKKSNKNKKNSNKLSEANEEENDDDWVLCHFDDWRSHTDCVQFNTSLAVLTSSDDSIRQQTTSALLKYIDDVNATPLTKRTTQLKNDNIPNRANTH